MARSLCRFLLTCATMLTRHIPLGTEPQNFPLSEAGLKRWNRMSSDYEHSNPNLVLRRVKYTGGAEIHKTVYFIRHGLSAWNQAQDDGDLAGLLNKDHPLTAEGVEQCLKLRYRWQVRSASVRTNCLSIASASASATYPSTIAHSHACPQLCLYTHLLL